MSTKTEPKTYSYKCGSITYRLTPQPPGFFYYEVTQSNNTKKLCIPIEIIEQIVKDRLREFVSTKLLDALGL